MSPLLLGLIGAGCTSGLSKLSDPAVGTPLAVELSSTPRNVLFIAVDTTRRDALGWWSGADSTPNLDALMREGVVLEDHRGCSNWTWDSVLCLQTSQQPYTLDFEYLSRLGAPNEPMSDTAPLVSAMLADRGFQTALVTAQPFMSPQMGMDRGFDEVFFENDVPASTLTDEALALLGGFDADAPWYLHLHYLDPHDLYTPPAALTGPLEPISYDPSDRSSWAALLEDYRALPAHEQARIQAHLWTLYLGELAFVDQEIGRLLDAAEGLGLLDDTLVVFWTDHGEQLWQHDHPTHGDSHFEEESRAAVALWSKALTARRWEGPTTHVDVWPTVLQLMGMLWEGPIGLPLGQRDPEGVRTAVRYRGADTLHMATRQATKMTYRWDGEKALYHLDDDPHELDNRYDPQDPEVLLLWETLLSEVDTLRRNIVAPIPVDPGP